MESRPYGKVGTTARAEPVNNQEILFPNGYDRNQNRDRPLVTVCDTACIDDDYHSDDDYRFYSQSPSEKVTVTIKFSSAIDSVVTETATENRSDPEYRPLRANDRSRIPDKETERERHTDRQPNFEDRSRDSSERVTANPCLSENTSDTELHVNDIHSGICETEDIIIEPRVNRIINENEDDDIVVASQTRDAVQNVDMNAAAADTSVEKRGSIQDNLYEEYERFIVPSRSDNEQVVRPKSAAIQPSNNLTPESTQENNKVRIISDESHHDSVDIDRSSIVSPIHKTPIVVESSSASGDEAEDFMEYLKQLRGHKDNDVSENASDVIVISDDDEYLSTADETKRKCDRDSTNVFKNELLPMLTVNASSDRHSMNSEEVIVISDEDKSINEQENDSKSLLDFNFQSLNKTKKPAGGNCVVDENPTDDTEDNGDTKMDIQKRKRKTRKVKTRTKRCNDGNDTEESDSEDADDDDQDENGDCGKKGGNRDSDRDDKDGTDNNGRENNSGFDEHDQNDRNYRDSNHQGDGRDQSSDSTESNGYENEGYYSPGMRSRSTEFSALENSNIQETNECDCAIETDIFSDEKRNINEQLTYLQYNSDVSDEDINLHVDNANDEQNNEENAEYVYPCKETVEETNTMTQNHNFSEISISLGRNDYEVQNAAIGDKSAAKSIPSPTLHTKEDNSLIEEASQTVEHVVVDEPVSDEDSEIIEILDYSEIVNNLDCTFQAIDTDTCITDGTCSPEDCEMSSSAIDGTDTEKSTENLETQTTEESAAMLKVVTNDSELGTSCEDSIQCQELEQIEVSGEVKPTVDTPAHDLDYPGDQPQLVDMSLFSESSSNAEVESDFESAIDEEFWTNTIGSALEASFSEDMSCDNDSDFAYVDGESFVSLKTDDYDGCKNKLDNDTDERAVFENMEDDGLISSFSSIDSDCTDSEYESADEEKSTAEEATDFVCKINQILEEKNNNERQSEADNYICTDVQNLYENNETDKKENELPTPENSDKDLENVTNYLKNDTKNGYKLKVQQCKPRTVTYFVPFIKEILQKITPNKRKEKITKHICVKRKSLLNKLLPLEVLGANIELNDSNINILTDNEHDLQVTIDDLKKKSTICKDNAEVAHAPVKRPGEIIKLGIGYYIFGAGEKLDLPIGPRLKGGSIKDHGDDTNRPSIYFRGVPGIINNAYKMSSFSLPKLANTTNTSSRKILHACNRLATQLSPLDTRPDNRYDTMSTDMTVEDNDDTLSVSSTDLTEMLLTSRDYLNSSRFDDAELAFLKLYKQIQEKPEDNGRLLVETLTGLADICFRRSRMCRSNPLEWQWLCMHAIALLQYTVEFCDSELEGQLDNEATEWYQEQRQASELKCRPLEDAFTRALYNCLKHDANSFDPFQSFSMPNTPVSNHRKPNLFPLSSTMPQYLLVPGMSYRVTQQGLRKPSSDDSDVAVDWLAKFQFYCKDRLQTKDSKCVTEKVLKSTKSADTDETESLLSNGSHGSLDWDHSDLHGIEELEMDITDKESPITEFCLEYELANSETDNEGWDFFLHERRNCDFQSVVQMVSNDEEKEDANDRENFNIDKETRDIYQQEKAEKSRKKHHEPRDIVSPLHAHSISLTLARSFCRLADKLVQEEEYKKAEIVYEKILDIIDSIQDGTAGMLRFSARIMKNLGTVKSKQGKSSSGLVLLNKALNTYRDLQDEEANFEIAVALIELGNGYIVGKNHEDSVFDDVIIAICDFFEKDAGDSTTSTSNSSSVQSHISQMTSSLTSNTEDRNVEEAVTCYSEAISLLDCYEADEKQVDMFAKAIMRLGDCHFMQKDYDKALECYEKALGMFRSYNVFGRDSLMENAHVLCMLGVSSFMLHVYPRAASVFETALHMVRCAYGFKRTFLNGMLQSLSGITYYKMKNYHKCVSMCYQGYETYCELFGESMSRLDKQKFWLVCQTLYVMGNSYNILNLQQKAMKYLTIARSLMKSSKSRERRQFMRVLQILGDCYFANYDYKTALQFYNEALEYGECESSISFDEVFDPNCASDEMTIHNHLVSKSAEAHLSMQQYQNAVHYLEQAHDMQEVMGEDIRGDLINTLHQLGQMHSVAGDVDKAIESYKECLEVFREIHKDQLGPEMCTTLGNLAAICYVKACIADSQEEEEEMNNAADSYFHEALALENNAEVSVKYGTFLFSHCNFDEAIVQCWNALRNDSTIDIVYRGLEKVTLPELLQDEVDTHDEICIPSTCLARYLMILCYKAMHEYNEAEINLICLMEEVHDYDVPSLHSLLGYAMMELMLFEEAAVCFYTAAETEEEYQLACENYCICLLILLQKTLQSGLENVLEYASKNKAKFCIDYSI